MRSLIDEIVRQQLEPYLSRIEALSDEIEDLRRRTQNLNRLGVVSQIHASKQMIKVKHGELETPFIKWFSFGAGRVSHYRCPTVNEQVLLINFGGGDNGSQVIALVGIDSEQFPFPSNQPERVVTEFGEKCAMIWDMDAGTLTLRASECITLDTPLVHATRDVHADGEVSDHTRTMQADREIYNEHEHPGIAPGLAKTQVTGEQQ